MTRPVRVTDLRAVASLLEQLPVLLHETRVRRRLSQHDVAVDLGVSKNTVSNFEQGQGVTTSTQRAVLLWLADVEVRYQR